MFVGYDRPLYTSSPQEEKVDTPFLSNFTKRLSQLSASNATKNDYDYKNDIIKEHDANGANSYARSYLNRFVNYILFVKVIIVIISGRCDIGICCRVNFKHAKRTIFWKIIWYHSLCSVWRFYSLWWSPLCIWALEMKVPH